MPEMTFGDQYPHASSWADREKSSPELGYRSVRTLIAASGRGKYPDEVRSNVDHVFKRLEDTTLAGALKEFSAAHASYEKLAEEHPDHEVYRAIADGMDIVRETLAQTIAQIHSPRR